MKPTTIKSIVAAALCAVGFAAVAEPTVTVGEVKTGEPWSKITVNYTLGGTDAKTDYKVAFNVTAKGQTASVTNDAAKLTDGAATKEIDTAQLFGKQVVDTQAKVKVTLIAVKPKDPPPAGQLWENGPIWAECNVGAKAPGDYGELYTFSDNKAADAAKSLGDGWRLPTDQELKDLLSNCEKNWETCKDSEGAEINGYRFTGKGDYSSNSIFLPAAGYEYGDGRDYAGENGLYWSSEAYGGDQVWHLSFDEDDASVYDFDRSLGLSVRAVRDAK